MQSSLPAPAYKPLRLAGPDQGMRYFARLYEGLNVAPMLAELEAHPELWDAYPERRIAPGILLLASDRLIAQARHHLLPEAAA